MVDRKYELGHERIGVLLAKYSAPAMVGMLVNSTYNLVDAFFVGHGAGTLALAGLAVAFPIQMLVLGLAQVVGIGSASIISRSLGAGDQRKAERMAGTSFATAVVLGFLLSSLGLAFLEPILAVFGASENVMPYASQYMGIILLGSAFFSFAVSTSNVVRAEGNARLAMTSMMVGAGTNLVLAPIFIFYFHWGVRGAATATVIANIAVFSNLTRYFLRGKSMLRIRRADLIPDFSLYPEMFGIGVSSFTRVAAGSVLAIVLNNSISHYGSDIHLAALGVINRVMLFFLMPMFGLIMGLQPIAGFNYGARNIPRVKEAIWAAAKFATLMSAFAFLMMMLFPRQMLMIFDKNPELISEGAFITRIVILVLPFVGFQIVGASVFQALGRAWPALFLSLTRQLVFLVPFLLLFPPIMGLTGLWVSFPVADSLSTIVTALWMMREMRRLDSLPPMEVSPGAAAEPFPEG